MTMRVVHIAAAVIAAVAIGACDSKSPPNKTAPAPAQKAPAADAPPPPDPAMVAAGEKVFEVRQCAACHTVDGTPGMGPTLAGIYGKRQTLVDGREVVVDIPYLRRSLIDPQADVVPGFSAQMLNYKDVISEKDIAALVAYIRTLKAEDEGDGSGGASPPASTGPTSPAATSPTGH